MESILVYGRAKEAEVRGCSDRNNLKFLNSLRIKILEPYSDISVNFLNSFSIELKGQKYFSIS